MEVARSRPIRSGADIGDQYDNWIRFTRLCGNALYTGGQPYSAI
jgi:hypothetical protein